MGKPCLSLPPKGKVSIPSVFQLLSLYPFQLTGDDSPVSGPFVSERLEGDLLSHPGLEKVSAREHQQDALLTTI
jgi:hypothetical protein